MAVTKRSYLSVCAAVGGTVLLASLLTSPASAGSAAAGGCTATARVETQWGSGPTGGQVATVRVVNTSARTSTKWTVGWTVGAGQRFAAVWNAGASTAGNEVTFVNAVYNGILAPGAFALFGVRLEGTGPAPALRCDNGVPVVPSSPPVPPSSVPPSVPPSYPPVSPSSSGSGLTYADNGRTVGTVVGATLTVSLGAEFRPTTVSSPILTQLSSSGGYPTGQPLRVLYRVAAAGRADITTRSDDPCFYVPHPCTVLPRQWAVHVVAIG